MPRRFIAPVVVLLVHVFAADARGVAPPAPPAPAPPPDAVRPQDKAVEPTPPPSDVAHSAQGSLSGLFTAGNVSSVAGAAAGFYQVKAFAHAVRVDVGAGVTGIAKDTDGNPANGFEEDLLRRLNTSGLVKLRYDYFLSDLDTLFTSGLVGHDSATNLLLRLRAEAGYRRYFFRSEKHSMSAEAGGVYLVDNGPFLGDTTGDGVVDLGDETRFEDTGGTIGARVMVQYTNALLDNVAFNQTLEVIPNLFPDVEAPFEATRVDAGADGRLGLGEATVLASTTSLVVTIDEHLAASLALGFLWDNGAIARRNAVSNADLSTLVTLTYKLF